MSVKWKQISQHVNLEDVLYINAVKLWIRLQLGMLIYTGMELWATLGRQILYYAVAIGKLDILCISLI